MVKRALAIDEENDEAKAILKEIEKQKTEYNKEREKQQQ
jgi:hypothetical protein